MGGDGRKYLDYDLIEETYKQIQSITKTAKIINCDVKTVKKILEERNIPSLSGQKVNQNKNGKIVNQYDLQGNYIQTFPSCKSAAISLGKITLTSKGASSHIADVCKGKRKSAYGFKWQFAEK